MHCSYVIEKPPGCVVMTIAGKPTLEAVRELIQSAAEDPRFEAGLHRLYDLRGLQTFLSKEEMRGLADYVTRMEDVLGERRTVLLVGSDLFFGLSRMLLTYIESGKARFTVTKDESEAKAAVGLAEAYCLPAHS